MALHIDLLRHGAVAGPDCLRGQLDSPLSEWGWQQMQAAVAGGQWRQIISSPLQRCTRFAQQLAETGNIPLKLDPRWQEISLGDWQGRNVTELQAEAGAALQRYWQSPWDNPPPGGERFDDFQGRVLAAWQELLHQPEAGTILVVTHAGVIRTLLAQILNIPKSHWFNIEVAHASISRIEYDPAATMCRLIHHGSTPHWSPS